MEFARLPSESRRHPPGTAGRSLILYAGVELPDFKKFAKASIAESETKPVLQPDPQAGRTQIGRHSHQ